MTTRGKEKEMDLIGVLSNADDPLTLDRTSSNGTVPV